VTDAAGFLSDGDVLLRPWL